MKTVVITTLPKHPYSVILNTESEVSKMIIRTEQEAGRGTLMEKYLEGYPPVLSADEVATILGVTGKTVRHLIKAGNLEGIKVGRLIRIPKDRLIEYLEGRN